MSFRRKKMIRFFNTFGFINFLTKFETKLRKQKELKLEQSTDCFAWFTKSLSRKATELEAEQRSVLLTLEPLDEE